MAPFYGMCVPGLMVTCRPVSRVELVDLGLPSGVESVCSSVTVEIFWRHRSMYKSFQVDLKSRLTDKLAPSSSLIQVIRGYVGHKKRAPKLLPITLAVID